MQHTYEKICDVTTHSEWKSQRNYDFDLLLVFRL